MAHTGGPLNELNGKMGISAPHRSVPVMKLIRAHRPKSRDELVELIRSHQEGSCECGIRSKGTVEDFGRRLYESQMEYWGEYRHSLVECMRWEYALFVIQSLKGGVMEEKAAVELNRLLEGFRAIETEGFLDEKMRIDLTLNDGMGKVRGGVQVKPDTYLYMRESVIDKNTGMNRKWGKPVFYLYYDNKGRFPCIDETIREIHETLNK